MIYFRLQSVGFLIKGGKESQFHSLFFMQAAVIARDICTAKRHSNLSEKEICFRAV